MAATKPPTPPARALPPALAAAKHAHANAHVRAHAHLPAHAHAHALPARPAAQATPTPRPLPPAKPPQPPTSSTQSMQAMQAMQSMPSTSSRSAQQATPPQPPRAPFGAARPPSVNRPADQAHGLRRLFAARAPQQLALLANPHVDATAVALERLAAALAALGRDTLVVDAAAGSPPPHELAALDLAACVEPIGPRLAYLAARGLPLAHVDATGSAAALLPRLQAAAPSADLLLVHADAADLVRLFDRAPPPVVVLAGTAPDSLTHAYAGMKLLALRGGCASFDLLVAAPPRQPLAARVAARIGSCAARFLGAAVADWVALDPAGDPREPTPPALLRLLAALLLPDDAAALQPAASPPIRSDRS